MGLEAEKMFYSALQHLHEGRIAEATDMLLALTGSHPGFARGFTELGDLFTGKLKDFDKAETFYKQALAAEASSPGAHAGYALLLILTERYAEANAHLNKAAAVAGAEKDRVYQFFGMLHEAQAHMDDAVAAYKKAILATFSDDLLHACEKAIARCEVKKKYL